MKKYFIALTILFGCIYTFSANAQTTLTLVGKLVNNVPTITVNQANLISTFNSNLLDLAGINGNFNSVSIIHANNGNYYLVFKGTVYKSTFAIQVDNENLNALGATTCTTSDCAEESTGCVPYTSGGCTPCAISGKCSKTVSSRSMLE